jgi:hypothetical protein
VGLDRCLPHASFERSGIAGADTAAAYGAFGAVGIGALGCVVGGSWPTGTAVRG